jgi:5-methylcytosine-specific restriction endonuclease McrA
MPIPPYKTKRCRCGCKEQFDARYLWKDGRGYYPSYKRGHHPNCRKTQTGRKPPWNKGKKKGDHPSLKRMGFQRGNKHWNWQEDQNPDWFSPSFDHVAFSRKFGHRRRTRYVSKLWGKFRDAILKRDGYECQRCGYPHGGKITDPTMLHVHHKEAIRNNRDRIYDDKNVITLCRPCHWLQHRGHKKRKRLP